MTKRVLIFCATVGLFSIWSFAYAQSKEEVREVCKDDYIEHCVDHEPYTTEGDACMRKAYDLDNLSKPCRTILVQRERGKIKGRIKRRVFRELRRWGIEVH